MLRLNHIQILDIMENVNKVFFNSLKIRNEFKMEILNLQLNKFEKSKLIKNTKNALQRSEKMVQIFHF
jgi:hypothetical protein